MNRPESRPTGAPGTDQAFAEPWQAEAFAMVVALQERGVFTWSEWAEALGAEVASPAAAADGSDYYEHWLRALERLLAARGIAEPASVDALASAWERAAHATPHGHPMMLENDPARGGAHPLGLCENAPITRALPGDPKT